jgi:hypothetical protein
MNKNVKYIVYICMEIQLPRGESWDPINLFNLAQYKEDIIFILSNIIWNIKK